MSDIQMTIHAVLNGFPVDIAFTGSIEQLVPVSKRLVELGAQPMASAPLGGVARKPAQPRVEPGYSLDGSPVCPKHDKHLKQGQYGLYCPAKDDSTERGYCNLKFKD